MNVIDKSVWKMNDGDSFSTVDPNKEIQFYIEEKIGIGMISDGNLSRQIFTETDEQNLNLTQESENDQLSLWIAAIPLIAMVVVNVFANGAIILIFIRKRCIRRCRNIYILSIAVADFLIGLSMPLSIMETLSRKWTFWPFSCWVFLMVRYSLFFISFISIILLTVDRWWSINFPFSYRVRQSRTMATIIVVCCWLVSFILHIPLVVGWDNFDSTDIIKLDTYCRVPPERNFIFTICAFVLEYLIPLTCLFVLNCGIYFKLSRRRNTKKIRRSMSSSDTYMLYSRKTSSDSGGSSFSNNNNNNSFDDPAMDVMLYSHIPDIRRHSVYLYTSRRLSSSFYKVPKNALSNFNRAHQSSRRVSLDTAALVKTKNGNHCVIQHKPSFPSRKQSDDVVKDFLVRQDKKAILSLGLLTLVASVCWTPYTISSLVNAFCPSCIPSWLSVFFYWIMAANSTINPFLYGIGTSDFRKELRTWLSCFNQQNYKMQDTLLYCPLQQNAELETLREYNVLQSKNSSL